MTYQSILVPNRPTRNRCHGVEREHETDGLRECIGRTQLAADLAGLGVRPGGTVMVHARMSALGYVIGGAETVVWALLDAVGPAGTIMVYAGWGDSPPDDLEDLPAAVRDLVLAEHPTFDPAIAHVDRSHGRVAEAIRVWPGAVRSYHPEAGVAAIGANAAMITANHPLDNPYGVGSPFAHLVELDGQVLMLGTGLDAVTLIHHAEAIAAAGPRRRVHYRAPIFQEGKRVWRWIDDIDTWLGAFDYEMVLGHDVHPGETITRDAYAAGIGRRRPTGMAVSHVFDARALTNFAVNWIQRHFPLEPATS